MAFECNLAAGNKAACQQHVTRQSVQHQQVLPEITGAPQTVHDPPPTEHTGDIQQARRCPDTGNA